MNNIKPRKQISMILYALFILFILTPLGVITMIRKTRNVFEQYPLKGNEQLHIKVLKSDIYKGSTLILDSDSCSFSVRSFSLDKAAKPLHYSLEKDDSIVKHSGSKILYLYKMNSDEALEFDYDWIE